MSLQSAVSVLAVPGTGQRTLSTFSAPARDSTSRGKARMRLLGQGELTAKGLQHSRLMCYMDNPSSKSGQFCLLRKLLLCYPNPSRTCHWLLYLHFLISQTERQNYLPLIAITALYSIKVICFHKVYNLYSHTGKDKS